MAGEYIEFNNNSQPAINDTNLNRLQQLIKQDIQGAVSGDTLPVGAIMPFGSDTIPDNWLLCNGQAVSRTTYQELFNTIGTTYGTGDGFTTFNLPNLQGKIPVGKNANDTDFDTLGETGGEKTHTLTINEMPSHNHQREQTGRALYWDEDLTEMGGLTSGVNVQISWNKDTTNTGGSQPHNNLQPYIVQNYIIKAKQSAGVVATVVDNLTSTSATNALSANQGKVLNDKFSRHIITANATRTISTAGVDTILTLNELVKVGNKLSVSNGKVVIGDGVSKVKVSAKALIDTPQLANSFFYLRKNNSNIISGDNYGIYVSISITDYLVSVQQGDSFSLLINTGLDANIYDGTYLTIEVVE